MSATGREGSSIIYMPLRRAERSILRFQRHISIIYMHKRVDLLRLLRLYFISLNTIFSVFIHYLAPSGLERDGQRKRERDREREIYIGRENAAGQAFLLFTTRVGSGDVAESDTSYVRQYHIIQFTNCNGYNIVVTFHEIGNIGNISPVKKLLSINIMNVPCCIWLPSVFSVHDFPSVECSPRGR